MKKMMFVAAMMMTISISANAMTYTEARYEAKVMTSNMTRDLGLSASQAMKVEKINLDYLTDLNSYSAWDVRDHRLQNVLTAHQYKLYTKAGRHAYRTVPPVPKHGPNKHVAGKPAPVKPGGKNTHFGSRR